MSILKFINSSIKNKVVLSHITAIMVITLLVEIVIYFFAVSLQLKDNKDFNLQMVNKISDNIDNIIVSFTRVFDHVTMDPKLQSLLKTNNKNTADKYLPYKVDTQLQSIAVDQTIFINELDALYLFDKDSLKVNFRRYYKNDSSDLFDLKPETKRYAKDGRVTWWTDGNTIYFDRAILDMNLIDGAIGYLTMTMHKKILQDVVDSVKLSKNRFIIITDESDNVIVTNYPQNEKNISKILNSIGDLNSNENKVENVEFIGKSLVTTQQSEYSKWKVISFVAISELTKGPIDMMKLVFLIVGAAALVIGFIFSFFSSSILVKPINLLTYLMDEVEREKLDVRADIRTKDELGRLGKSFNNMVEKINYLIFKVYQEEIKFKEAELKALQSQINPHFLYNTLDCINWLAEFGRIEDIRSVTIGLSNLMKTSANNRKSIVRVEEEIENIKSYLSISKITLGDKFQYFIEIDDMILNYSIPKLILQPIVENAVIHGIKKKIGSGYIHIKGLQNDGKIVFQIFDDGIGMTKNRVEHIKNNTIYEDTSSERTGSGLQNIKERIKLIYGEEYDIDIQSNEGVGTVVVICIPVRERQVDEDL